VSFGGKDILKKKRNKREKVKVYERKGKEKENVDVK
jgi:hypothetical protein